MQSLTVKRVMNILYFNLAWLSNISLNSLKPFISGPVRLIDKRGLICDHRNIGLNFRRMFVYSQENICLHLSDFDRGPFQDLKTLTFLNIFLDLQKA